VLVVKALMSGSIARNLSHEFAQIEQSLLDAIEAPVGAVDALTERGLQVVYPFAQMVDPFADDGHAVADLLEDLHRQLVDVHASMVARPGRVVGIPAAGSSSPGHAACAATGAGVPIAAFSALRASSSVSRTSWAISGCSATYAHALSRPCAIRSPFHE